MLYAGRKWWKRAFFAYWLRHILPPEWLIKRSFSKTMGYSLNLADPQTFNEKIQWLKLYYHDPAYIKMVDKAEAKEYISSKIGTGHVIPTLKIYESVDEIDLKELPDKFVLKCTHDSGSIVICKDKSHFDLEEVRKNFRVNLQGNYYYDDFEWPYKAVKPRVIAEPYLVDESHAGLKDYKVFCFGGEPKIIKVDFNQFASHQTNVYDTKWNFLEMEIVYPYDKENVIEKPASLEEMLEYARKLSAGMPFVRTDFYCVNGKIYVGEITFYPTGGCGKITPVEWDYRLSSWIRLPEKRIG